MISGYSIKSKHHMWNEDYFLIQGDKFIVADGCSSVKNADIGVRLLTHCNMAGRSIGEMGTTVNILGLDINCLCATQLIGELYPNNLYGIKMFGDGFFVYKRTDDPKIYYQKYWNEDNAPNYPIYEFILGKDYKKKQLYSESNDEEHLFRYSYGPEVCGWFGEGCDWFCVCTDGIGEYVDKLQEVFDFKSLNGDFVARRFQHFEKNFGKPSDDLTIVGVKL